MSRYYLPTSSDTLSFKVWKAAAFNLTPSHKEIKKFSLVGIVLFLHKVSRSNENSKKVNKNHYTWIFICYLGQFKNLISKRFKYMDINLFMKMSKLEVNTLLCIATKILRQCTNKHIHCIYIYIRRTLALCRPKKLLYGHYGDQKIKETFSGPLNILIAYCRRFPILKFIKVKEHIF